jgi:hypothetical protein
MNLAKLHSEAIAKYRNVRNRLDSHKQTIGGAVTRPMTAIESGVGGAAAAAIDHYLGDKTQVLPEAMVGPVPVVMASAFAGTLLSIVWQKEEWSTHLAGLSNGLGAAAAYAEGLRFLKAHEAATAPAAGAVT